MNAPYTPEQLVARAEFIEQQMATWKGNPDYADTLRMEAWALRTAAANLGAEQQEVQQ